MKVFPLRKFFVGLLKIAECFSPKNPTVVLGPLGCLVTGWAVVGKAAEKSHGRATGGVGLGLPFSDHSGELPWFL